jgi:AhpC/TSA family
MRRATWAAPAMLAGVLLYGCHWPQTYKSASPPQPAAVNAEVGQPAPAIDDSDLNGERLCLADYQGKVVVLQFWANW